MLQESKPFKNIFLAAVFDERLREELAHTFRLPLEATVVRWEKKANLHLTLGYIAHVPWDKRGHVIEAFKPLKEIKVFMVNVLKGLTLGKNGDSLCLAVGPYAKLLGIHEFAEEMLLKATSYTFDDTYTEYIPHIKIQALRHYLDLEDKKEIIKDFMTLSHRKFKFKIKSLALMERGYEKSNYVIIHEYKLSR